jgi:hypothetical protein
VLFKVRIKVRISLAIAAMFAALVGFAPTAEARCHHQVVRPSPCPPEPVFGKPIGLPQEAAPVRSHHRTLRRHLQERHRTAAPRPNYTPARHYGPGQCRPGYVWRIAVGRDKRQAPRGRCCPV